MARRRNSNRRRRRGSFGFLYKLLSTLVICGAIIAALTLFFRVDNIVVTGQQRYTAAEVAEATGVELGDNLYLLNKNRVANNILEKLPYIEYIHPYRRLPDTLVIEITECGTPLAVVQDGSAWLISPSGDPGGKIVDQKDASAAADYGIIDGCQLLAPTVGTPMALATEYANQQTSLLALMKALHEAGMIEQVDAIHLDDLSVLSMDYAGRFTVQLSYGADYAQKLKALRQILEESGAIQDNMTGTFDMRRDDGQIPFKQNVR